MKKKVSSNPTVKRLSALLLALIMLLSVVPATVFGAPTDADPIETVADPETLTRPDDIYGNDTEHAGKVTVGKSVSTGSVTVPLTGSTNTKLDASDPNNFMVTVSQSAQVMGITSETSVPVDVVFVLDTSGSMDDNNRAENMVTAANDLIEELMASNAQNRIGVVTFSGSNGDDFEETTTVLSALDHYEDGTGSNWYDNRLAASNHISWNGDYLRGRNADNSVNTSSTRHGKYGGTNIQAGIARGAQMLTNATNTTVMVDTNGDGTADSRVTRMPVLVILSDGAPTYSADNTQWWNPNGSTQGAGNTERSIDAGEGFLAMLTAAYYKNAIAEHYYGADSDQKAAIYTIGVSLGNITSQYGGYRAGAETTLSNLTMNPTQWLGVSISNTTIDDNITSYWNSYRAGRGFSVDVGINNNNSNGSYSFTASGTNANILSSVTDLKYNDRYWATGDSDIGDAFDELSSEISKKAMSVPTMVTTTEDFSGYVTFTDVLGEYMELKDMVGIVANGKVYRGVSFAKHLSDYGEVGAANNDPEFDASLREVMQTRLNMTDSMKNNTAFVEENLAHAKASAHQAYYNSDTDYDNSLVWWGATYDVGEEDTNIQNLGYADDDSIAYIEEQRAAGEIPAGADCVVRSYFFYGSAGETDQEPNHEYLYFVVRVSRSLTAPYQQTVVISAPASLLSMERVLIHEESDGTYTAEVEEELPARVVYEVGLRSDINPYNVKQIVADNYKNETVNGDGTVNYDAATDTYSFFTNDWNRTQALDEHHRAMTKATFDAAADNAFYRYQENETLYVQSGSTYTKYTGATLPNGVYYYAREGYSWSGQPTDGKYTAQPETFYVKMDVEDDNRASIVKNADNTWYIPAGLYTASTLQVNGDDTMKDDLTTTALNDGNKTGSAAVVAHPHRTGNVNNSHYTVLLGNNGLLQMKAKDAKTVSIGRGNTTITNADGKAVMVGDELTYTIEAMNTTGQTANIVITDKVPAGTEFVSAANGGTENGGTITWTVNNVAAGATASVSFTVEVTEAALDSAVVNIENQATVKIGNEPAYTTNTTTNPPEGKKVASIGGTVDGKVQVGSELTYEIRYANDTDAEQDITITDIVPAGTAYITNSATYAGNASIFAMTTNSAGQQVLTWTLTNVQPGVTGTVSFRVTVTAEAVEDNNIQNYAEIKVGPNDPYITTNSTNTPRETGSIKLRKIVAAGDDQTVGFTMILTEATGTLDGTFDITGASDAAQNATAGKVTFTAGAATIKDVKHGTDVTISGLPLNASIAVREEAGPGWTPTYNQRIGVVANGSAVQTLQISNDYQTVPAHFQLSGTKTYVGTWPENSAVNFMARSCDENGVVDGARTVYAVATKDANASTTVFKFPERTFDSAQTLYYLISEYVTDANRIADVDYDKTVYLMKLEIKDNGQGALVATTTMKTGTTETSDWSTVPENNFVWATEEVAFTNTYYSASNEIVISGGKTMSGRDMVDGEFIFELVDTATSKVASTAIVVDTSDAKKGSFAFAPITYTLADLGGAATKEFIYTVRENKDNPLPGVTYDTDEFTVKVTVTKNADGTLNAVKEVTNPAGANIEFQNSYVNTGYTTYTPVANKVLVERAAAAGEFRFEVVSLTKMSATTYDASSGTVVSRGVSVAAGEGAAAAITFQPIGYTDPHPGAGGDTTFYYMIREVKGTDNTITYDPTVYLLEVVVHDNTAENDLYVTSVTYKAATLAGNVLTTGGGIVSGTPEQVAAAQTKATFTNRYGSGQVELNVAFDKKFNYGDTAAWIGLSGSEFDFEVYETDSNFTEPGAGVQPITVGTNGAVGADGKAAITFVPTHITKEKAPVDVVGTPKDTDLYYLVKEVVPSNAGTLMKIAGDIGVKLTIHNDGYGGLTVKSTTYYKQDANNVWQAQSPSATNEERLFLNTYNANPVSIRIPIDKMLQGKDLSYTGGADKFSFKLEGGNLAQPVILTTDENGLAAHTLTFEAKDMSGAAFDSERGAWGKTFTFTVSEENIKNDLVNGEDNGTYTKDPKVYTVKVFVTEDGSGQLKAAAYVDSERLEVLNFTNTYTPKAVELDVNTVLGQDKITKSVVYPNGTVAPIKPENFTFSVVDTMGQPVKGVGGVDVKGTVDADGAVTFAPNLTFTEPRDYHFWIVEDSTTVPGITIDQRRWEMHVAVGYDTAEGKLTIDSKKIYPISRATEAVTEIEFVNTYEPKETTLMLTADKTLTGREMLPGEFHFQLVEGDRIVTEAVNGAPDQNGKATVTFHVNYTYADLGEHTYKIVEVNAGKGGVTYDATEREIVVKVEDESGQLKAYVTNAAGSTPVAFANTYATAPVDVPINAFKHLTGKALTDGAYTFELVDAAGQIVTAKNDADGKIEFTKTFTAATEQPVVYTLREKNDAQSGVTYDKAEYKVTISVIDDLHGRLIPVITYTTADGQPTDYDIPVFINSYDAASVDVTLSAEKELKGRGMKDGEFLFKVYDSFGTLISEGKNEKDGDVIFTPITFGELGKYTLRVVEVDTGDKDISYDDSEFTVTVLITDDGKGQLQAKVTYPDGGVTFTNTWQSQTAPNTGDTFNAPLMVGMLVFSAAVLVLLLFLNKRKKEDTAE